MVLEKKASLVPTIPHISHTAERRKAKTVSIWQSQCTTRTDLRPANHHYTEQIPHIAQKMQSESKTAPKAPPKCSHAPSLPLNVFQAAQAVPGSEPLSSVSRPVDGWCTGEVESSPASRSATSSSLDSSRQELLSLPMLLL